VSWLMIGGLDEGLRATLFSHDLCGERDEIEDLELVPATQ